MAFVYLVPIFPLCLAWGRARIEWEAYDRDDPRDGRGLRPAGRRARCGPRSSGASPPARLRLDVAVPARRRPLVRRASIAERSGASAAPGRSDGRPVITSWRSTMSGRRHRPRHHEHRRRVRPQRARARPRRRARAAAAAERRQLPPERRRPGRPRRQGAARSSTRRTPSRASSASSGARGTVRRAREGAHALRRSR